MQKSNVIILLVALGFAIATAPAPAADHSEAVRLQSQRKPAQTDRVVVRLEVGGETKFTDKGKSEREKMSVRCDLDYFEKPMQPSPDGADRSVRQYEKVSATVKVGDDQYEPDLKPEHRLIVGEAGKQSVLMFSPHGNLSRDELDSIDVPVGSLLLDRLLPDDPVAVGDVWPHSAELLAAMLGLDEVAKTTVQSTLREVTKDVARFDIAGRVEGTARGLPATADLKGRYRFDRRTNRIDWLGMLIKEDREISQIEEGIEAVSRLQITITPADEPPALADAALAELSIEPTPESQRIRFESPAGDWRCLHDRRWHLKHWRPKSSAVVLLFLDRGIPVGQCNLASLPTRKPDALPSLEDFQEDVRMALGKNFAEFVSTGQSSNEANYRIYRVAARGQASEIPMQWIYYLVADPEGRQTAFTFAVEQSLIERFADADKPLVESLRFVEKK